MIGGVYMNSKNILEDVFTATEAAIKWGLESSSIRKAIAYGRFKIGEDYRKAGRVTLISREAMIRLYGEPPKTSKKESE